MAYSDFTFPDVLSKLGLTLREESELFGSVAEMKTSDGFEARMASDVDLGLLIGTEKARSEFIIAPVLTELRRQLNAGFSLFSGVEFNVDSARGLNGYCDFMISRSKIQSVLTSPIIAVTEVKNDDTRKGLGQCIAAMVAALQFNASESRVYGVVTTGNTWKFLMLVGTDLTLDLGEYYPSQFPKIMGILAYMITDG